MIKRPDDDDAQAKTSGCHIASPEEILILGGMLAEIFSLVRTCDPELRERVWTRLSCVADALRHMRQRAIFSEEQQGDAAK